MALIGRRAWHHLGRATKSARSETERTNLFVYLCQNLICRSGGAPVHNICGAFCPSRDRLQFASARAHIQLDLLFLAPTRADSTRFGRRANENVCPNVIHASKWTRRAKSRERTREKEAKRATSWQRRTRRKVSERASESKVGSLEWLREANQESGISRNEKQESSKICCAARLRCNLHIFHPSPCARVRLS